MLLKSIFSQQDPLREFAEKFIFRVSTRFPKAEGILEVNPFEDNDGVLRELKLPKHAGIGPVSLLPVKVKKANLSK